MKFPFQILKQTYFNLLIKMSAIHVAKNYSHMNTEPAVVPQEVKISLSWNELSYKVTHEKTTTHVLKNVSGFANPGEILAIMGSSGCGKTTFLSILSNQIFKHSNVETSGTVMVNGADIKSIDYASIAKYVMQEDVLLTSLTPREALYYSYKLKTKKNNSLIHEKIVIMLDDLKLTKCADTIIGNAIIKGLSGGEKKKTLHWS